MNRKQPADRGDTVRLNCDMKRDEYERVRALARKRGIPLTHLIRAVVARAVETDGASLTAPIQTSTPTPTPAPTPAPAPAPTWDPRSTPWALRDTSWQAPGDNDAPLPEWHETTAVPWGDDDENGAAVLDLRADW